MRNVRSLGLCPRLLSNGKEYKMILDYSQNGFKMIFEITDAGSVVLKHFGKKDAFEEKDKSNPKHSIVSVHVSGDNPNDHHFFKHTGCSADYTLKYVKHECYENDLGTKLEFTLEDGKIRAVAHYQLYRDVATVRAWSVITNISGENVGLEYVSSFSYSGIDEGALTPNENLEILIPHNCWCRELDWRKYSLSDLGIEGVAGGASKRINVCSSGTWSTKEYVPTAALINKELQSAYLWQIENNGSWQWEIAATAGRLYLKLSGPTDNENQWYKELAPGESFESVTVALSLGESFDSALAEMTAYRRQLFENQERNSSMAVIFNDYMNCLGADPTEEKELPVIDLAAKAGAEYYVMDAGWYADGTWWETVGEWMPCEWRFPHGLKSVFDYVKSKGMVPGIWLEIEVMGINCPLAKVWPDDRFFMRHGKRVIDHGRYQLDFRNPEVRDFATGVVDRLIRDYGIGYFKIDYNIEGGMGTELDADSFGDGLLGHTRAVFEWTKSIMDKYPSLIIENCASGGMRMDYKMLSVLPIQSTSDQTNYKLNANIAAKSSTAVLPEQSAVWAYPLARADKNEIQMNMVNALLQRIHLSGQIFGWNEEQMAYVKEAIEVYKSYRHEIPESIPFYPTGIPHASDKFFCSAYKTPSCIRLGAWRMDSESDTFFIPLDTEYANARVRYPLDNGASVTRVEGGINVTLPEQFTAVIVEVF